MIGAPRAWALLLAGAALAGCEPYRVEYRRQRPAYYQRMSDAPIPDRVQLDDGTIIVYGPDENGKNHFRAQAEGSGFKLRTQDDDGTVRLHALLPEHVVANGLHCLRQGEYRLIWDELLAERTHMAYEAEELGYEDFERFCRINRVEMARTLNRMLVGFVHHEVAVERRGDGIIECRFWPHVENLFDFRVVEIAQEGFGLKLAVIR